MEKGCLCWRRASTSTGAASHTSACGPVLGPGASSEPGRGTGSGSGWGSGLWGAGKTPSVSYLSDKGAGVAHQARAQSLFQMHIRGSGSRAGRGSPCPGLVALPGGAPCQGAERRGLGWHVGGWDTPLLLSPATRGSGSRSQDNAVTLGLERCCSWCLCSTPARERRVATTTCKTKTCFHYSCAVPGITARQPALQSYRYKCLIAHNTTLAGW